MKRILPLLVLTVVFWAYAHTPADQTPYDSKWSIHIAQSILHEGNLDLDEYRGLITPNDYRVGIFDDRVYSVYPIGSSLLATPIVYLYNLVRPGDYNPSEQLNSKLQVNVASLIVALTATLLYLIARRSLNVGQSLLVISVFAFCTPAWSTASRALWPHGPTMLILSLALYLILMSKSKPWIIQFTGILFAFSVYTRPLNAISAFFFTILVWLRYRRYFLMYLIGAMITISIFLLINKSMYGEYLAPYYGHTQSIAFHSLFWQALAGQLFSPSRGLFIYSPVLLFSLYGAFVKLRRFSIEDQEYLLDALLLGVIIAHWLAISAWPVWWGGHSFGPRLFSDVIPYLVYFLIPVIPILMRNESKIKLLLTSGAFIGLLGVSFFANYQGAMDPNGLMRWNNSPMDVNLRPSRVWNWYDAQFLRLIKIPQIDRLIPVHLATQPVEIYVDQVVGSQDQVEVELKIFDLNFKGMNWFSRAPSGVKLSPNRGSKRINEVIVTISTQGYSPGRHQLGEIFISARRRGAGPDSTVSVSVPIILNIHEAQ